MSILFRSGEILPALRLQPGRSVDDVSRNIAVLGDDQRRVLLTSGYAGGELEARQDDVEFAAGMLQILAQPPARGEVVHDQESRFEEVRRRGAEKQNLVAVGPAADHAHLGGDARHHLLHHGVEHIEHGQVRAVPVAKAGIAVDVEQAHINVGNQTSDA